MWRICSTFLVLFIAPSKQGRSTDDIQLSFSHIQNGYEGSLWPGGIIPYQLATSVTLVPQMERVIKHAMKDWQVKSCIRFVERTNETDYVEFQHYHNGGCNSDVGYHGGKQVISLNKCGFNIAQVLHEIGHIIGFGHEQSRPDRDKYVIIYRRNIRDGYLEAFEKYDASYFNTLQLEYDYHSIMHYKMKDFSKNGGYTILPRKKGIRSLGNNQLSLLDIKKTIMLYKCNDWASWTPWSACDNTCDDGTQERKRICTNSRGGTCNGTELQKRVCNMGKCPDWPDFPSDFNFRDARKKLSIQHLRTHRHKEDECILIHESEDMHHWVHYIFCNRGKRKLHMKWSPHGPIPGLKCTHIYEPKEDHGWDNNYLCIPYDSPYNLIWSYDGRKENMSCVQWHAKEGKDGWDDNFLCTKGFKKPIHGAWSSWTQWSECQTQCGKGKQNRERSCNNPKPLNEGRPCAGSHLDEQECYKDHCRYNVCGGALKGSQGTFVSPNFPHNYPNNLNCTWIIKSRSLKRVLLSIESMDIEDTTSCMFDFLMVRDRDYGGKELGRFCGANIPEEVVSKSNALWISFVTDGMIGKSGFSAQWIHD